MAQFNCPKFFRVYLHETSISEMPANDFKRTAAFSKDVTPTYSLPSDTDMFYDYPGIVQAMEGAKTGAISHINKLLKKAGDGAEELFQYRYDHYNDLNFNLTESNIRKVESELKRNLPNNKVPPEKQGAPLLIL
jgi:hypothetical protein